MWRGEGARVLHVAVGPSRVDWVLARAGQRIGESTGGVDMAKGGLEALTEALSQLSGLAGKAAADAPVTSVRAVVFDTWLSAGAVPWSDELKDSAAASRYARLQLEAAGYEPQAEDTVRLDDGPYGQPRMAVGYPALLMHGLEKLAQGLGSRLESVLPLSAIAWAWARRSGKPQTGVPLLVWAPSCLMVLQGNGHLSDVTVRGPAFGVSGTDPAPQALLAHWQRMAFRSPALERVKELQGLRLWQGAPVWPELSLAVHDVQLPAPAGTVPLMALCLAQPLRASALDAAAHGLRAGSTLQKALCATLAAAALALGFKAIEHWHASQAVAQQVADRGRRSASGSGKQAEGWREEPARVASVNAAIRELNMPVSALMQALQAPRDLRVALLSVDMSAAAASQGSAVVKIVAEARSGAEMARYVSHISGRGPIGLAYLTRHEVLESNPEQPYRFVVEAQWMP